MEETYKESSIRQANAYVLERRHEILEAFDTESLERVAAKHWMNLLKMDDKGNKRYMRVTKSALLNAMLTIIPRQS